MKQRLFNLATGVSLLLLLAVLVLWPVSYRYVLALDRAEWHDVGDRALVRKGGGGVGAVHGRVSLDAQSNRADSVDPPVVWTWEWDARQPRGRPGWGYGEWRSRITSESRSWRRLGVEYNQGDDGGFWHWDVSVPCSYFAVALSLLPAAWLHSRQKRRARLRNPDACRRCGYDLTANVSGVCPECGTPVQKAAAPVC